MKHILVGFFCALLHLMACATYSLFSMERVVQIVPDALAYEECGRMLQEYTNILRHILGAQAVIDQLRLLHGRCDLENMGGHLFELQVAAAIHCRRDMRIIQLGGSPYGGDCEFDIITDQCLIECKNINMLNVKFCKLTDQFLRQKKAAQVLNKYYVIFFKGQQISEDLASWLQQHDIRFYVV